VAQIARAGWMGADAWDLDDTMHSNGHGGLKVWGFWDSSAQSDMSLRPWFYSWTLLSHALPQGAQILPVQVASAPDHFRATAARWTRNGQQQQSIVLINDDDTPRTVRFQLPVTNGRPFYCFQYLEKDRPADAGGFPKPARRISPGSHPVSIDLPGRALIVLSTESR